MTDCLGAFASTNRKVEGLVCVDPRCSEIGVAVFFTGLSQVLHGRRVLVQGVLFGTRSLSGTDLDVGVHNESTGLFGNHTACDVAGLSPDPGR